MKGLTHLSLFSGIGGLDLAAEWAGMETVGQCEWAEYPNKVLERHWPDVPRWKDIRALTGESFYERTGRRTVDVISGGFPCQPFSVAGKRRGKEDDRYLWPEMVRVVKELRPAWVVGENVAGIVRMALPDILSELEACGYRTRAFLVPACAVGARHRRYRVAIVGYRAESMEDASGSRCGETGDVCEQQRGTELERSGEAMADSEILIERGLPVRTETEKPGPVSGGEDVQHTDSPGCREQHVSAQPEGEGFPCGGFDEGDDVPDTDNRGWNVRGIRESPAVEETGREWCDIGNGEEEHGPGRRRPTESGLGGVADGLPGRVDGYWDVEPDIPRVAGGVPHRADRLKALGNAVVPQQFYPVFRAIADACMGGSVADEQS